MRSRDREVPAFRRRSRRARRRCGQPFRGAEGLIERKRSKKDERSLNVTITDAGLALEEQAKNIPNQLGACVNINDEEADELYRLLYKILGKEGVEPSFESEE